MEVAKEQLSDLQVFTPSVVKKLGKFGIFTALDALQLFPRKYLDFSNFVSIKDLEPETTVTVKVKIVEIKNKFSFKSKKNHTESLVSDLTGNLKVVWFNQAYVAKVLSQGQVVYLSGKVDYYQGLQMVNPSFEVASTSPLHTGRLVPVYKLPEGVYDKTFRKSINLLLSNNPDILDPIPASLRKARSLLTMTETVQELHFPSSKVSLKKATERLAYEASLIEQLALAQNRERRKKYSAPNIPFHEDLLKRLVSSLPFTLTGDQKKALWQIIQDLEHKFPMNRLLLGDVGSGKTIVSLLASLEVITNGYKVAFLVPTEILAIQHYESFCELTKLFGLPRNTFSLHTGSQTKYGQRKTTKQNLQKKLISDSSLIIIGTHALLEADLKFSKLALVIIDEQHRFGVKQRSKLLKQLDLLDNKKYTIPHLLSMSATPIPRTLALSLYSDLEVSVISEKPKKQLPIKTWVIPESKRVGAYEFIRSEVKVGRQAFIITPLVEESDKLLAKSAKAEFKRLQTEIFPNLKLDILHGSLSPKDKEKVMQNFKQKKFHILVATSIIEVGIDIPNATVILIENAERFGLAQLHQLRGRVGRSHLQSYCFVFMGSDHLDAVERLTYFSRNTDGFKLSEFDLKKRGFGSFFGTAQTGFDFKYPEYLTFKVLENAKIDANKLIKSDPELTNSPDLLSKVRPLTSTLHLE